MSWISYTTSPSVNRKKELDKKILADKEAIHQLLKSTMVGSTYYAAVKLISTGQVFAIICATSIRNKNGYTEFSYTNMTENDNPIEAECPMNILELLSPTDDKNAINWRKNCLRYLEFEEKYKSHKTLHGTIKTSLMNGSYKAKDEITLYWVDRGGKYCYFDGYYKWSKKMIWKYIDDLTIVE